MPVAEIPVTDRCKDGTKFIGPLLALAGVQKVETNLSNVILNSSNNTKKDIDNNTSHDNSNSNNNENNNHNKTTKYET